MSVDICSICSYFLCFHILRNVVVLYMHFSRKTYKIVLWISLKEFLNLFAVSRQKFEAAVEIQKREMSWNYNFTHHNNNYSLGWSCWEGRWKRPKKMKKQRKQLEFIHSFIQWICNGDMKADRNGVNFTTEPSSPQTAAGLHSGSHIGSQLTL